MSAYWDWWWGALALGALTVAHQVVVGRRLGVSAAWERVVHWREEREAERLDAQFDDVELEAALAAALAELPVGAPGGGALHGGASDATSGLRRGAMVPVRRRAPVAASAAFLLSIVVGGLVAAVSSGRFELRGDMGPGFDAIVTDGPLMWPILFVGGLLVGLGTRLAGGCSSGHGLSGCGRFQPVSLVATAVFFGTAVVVSMLLWKVI